MLEGAVICSDHKYVLAKGGIVPQKMQIEMNKGGA
jgi:hypothetical protein